MRLETVHLQLVGLGDANFGQKLANVVALIALQLNHFTILGMIDHGAVTGELLKEAKTKTKVSKWWWYNDDATASSPKDAHRALRASVTYLFACFHNFLLVEVVGNALHGGQRLAAVTLLNPNVD